MEGNVPISIVVPVYNVGEYLIACVESILMQTFSDFELLLVDDGSSGETLDILNYYATVDERVRVLRKENGGVSSARNFGVAHAHGRYVTFVDGDDVVSPYYLEALLSAMRERNNCMVIGKDRILAHTQVCDAQWQKPSGVLCEPSRVELSEMILYKQVGTVPWGRMALRQLYLDHPFPEGVWYEDTRTIAEFVANVDNFAVVDKPIYGYVMRPGSTTWPERTSIKRALDYYAMIGECEEAFAAISPDLRQPARYFDSIMKVRLHTFLRNVEERDGAANLEKRVRADIRTHLPKLLFDQRASRAGRMRLALYCASPAVYDKVYAAYLKKRKGIY